MPEKKTTLLSLILSLGCLTANSALIIDVSQSGGDVVFQSSGTLDVTSATPSGVSFGPGSEYAGVSPNFGTFDTAPTGAISEGYNYTTTGGSFGPGGSTFSAPPFISATGDAFSLNIWLMVPIGFTNGPISFNTTFFGTDYATLGLTPGDYTWTIPGDSVTMSIAPASVIPEPSTYIAVAGFAALGVFLYRRRKHSLTNKATAL